MKEINGDLGKRLNAKPKNPELDHGRPEIIVPDYIPASAKKEFERLAGELADRNLYADMFRTQLAAYCDAYAEWRLAIRELGHTGKKWVERSAGGHPMPSPWIAIKRQARKEMNALAVEMGLTLLGQVRLQGQELPPSKKQEKKATDKWAGVERMGKVA